jgi:hypothetical protein
MRAFPQLQLLSVVLTASVAACGAGDLTLPGDGSPASLQAVSGSGQKATVGTPLPKPLIVRLVDRAGRQVSGVPVAFRFQSDVPGAQFVPSLVATDDTGFAKVQVVLGTTPGDQTIEAAIGPTPSPGLLATFGVTAEPAKNDGGGGGGPGRPGNGPGHGGDNDGD